MSLFDRLKAGGSDKVVATTPSGPNINTIFRWAGLAVLLMLVLAFSPVSQVPSGSRGIITAFGEVRSVRHEGLQFHWPWEKVQLISLRADSADVKKSEGGTKDSQPVHTDMTVRYEIKPDAVEEVYVRYARDGNMDRYVETATQEAFKAVTARYSADELITKRAQVSLEISGEIDKRVDKFGVNIISVDMTQFSFSQSYMQAVNEKVTEEQKKLAAENALKRIQIEQQQQVVSAKAGAEATRERTDAEAYSVTKLAEARAEALRKESSALRESKDVLDLRRIEVDKVKAEKWNGALPTHIYGSAPMPWMNIDASKPVK
jgi:regulator of protease activity HflC (stomatin/prohibitin superfamily)